MKYDVFLTLTFLSDTDITYNLFSANILSGKSFASNIIVF